MRVIPKKLVEMLWFFASRVDTWAENPGAIGLEASTVAAVEQAVLDMEAARAEAARTRQLAEAASATYRAKAGTLRKLGAGAVASIKAHAQTTGDASVYPAARIPEPAGSGQGAAPGTPVRFRVCLLNGGRLQLDWDCDNGRARGVVYEVRRSADGGPFAVVDIVAEKRFVDATLPSGTGRAIYRVTPARVAGRAGHGGSALVRGPSVDHIVSIGTQNVDEARAAA